jgi:imidazolonepropionase-like amidohydrolase
MPLGRESLVAELALMIKLGMSPMAAIESCTRQAARLLGVAGDLGSLEPGLLADLVIVRGDPLNEISALNAVQSVIKGGKILDPGTAEPLLGTNP